MVVLAYLHDLHQAGMTGPAERSRRFDDFVCAASWEATSIRTLPVPWIANTIVGQQTGSPTARASGSLRVRATWLRTHASTVCYRPVILNLPSRTFLHILFVSSQRDCARLWRGLTRVHPCGWLASVVSMAACSASSQCHHPFGLVPLWLVAQYLVWSKREEICLKIQSRVWGVSHVNVRQLEALRFAPVRWP